jgi:membrane protein implicated in regulation of membrane protease activity
MLPNLLVWCGAVVVFLVIEGVTAGLTTIWFAGGSLVALIATALNAPYWLQGLLFLVVSVLLLACLRPFVRAYVSPNQVRTNADRVVGMQALVTERIDNLNATGAVKVSGVEWTARSVTGEPIEAGALVVIRTIEGVKVCVDPVPVPAQA